MASILAQLVLGIIMLNLTFFSMLFICIALGLWLGDLTGSNIYGFLILGAFFLFLFGLILFLRKKIGLKEFLEAEFNKILKLNE